MDRIFGRGVNNATSGLNRRKAYRSKSQTNDPWFTLEKEFAHEINCCSLAFAWLMRLFSYFQRKPRTAALEMPQAYRNHQNGGFTMKTWRITIALLLTATLFAARSQNGLVPLVLYWNQEREDNFSTASEQGGNDALGSGYGYARVEACVFSSPQPGTVKLNSYWNAARGDNFTTATSVGVRSARQAGYTFTRIEGYVYANPRAGTIPLRLYWSAEREDNFTTGTEEGARSALEAGYGFARIEGYAYPASACQ
jgi:hypothetical protein